MYQFQWHIAIFRASVTMGWSSPRLDPHVPLISADSFGGNSRPTRTLDLLSDAAAEMTSRLRWVGAVGSCTLGISYDFRVKNGDFMGSNWKVALRTYLGCLMEIQARKMKIWWDLTWFNRQKLKIWWDITFTLNHHTKAVDSLRCHQTWLEIPQNRGVQLGKSNIGGRFSHGWSGSHIWVNSNKEPRFRGGVLFLYLGGRDESLLDSKKKGTKEVRVSQPHDSERDESEWIWSGFRERLVDIDLQNLCSRQRDAWLTFTWWMDS